MVTFNKLIYIGVAILAPLSALAHNKDDNRFAVKAYGQIGLGEALSLNPAIDGMASKSSGKESGLDFGWTFWQKSRHSLEANIGVGYNLLSSEMTLPGLNYSYNAPAVADMDGESYIRYYELKAVRQKSQIGRLTVPVYLSYGFRCVKWLGIHADLGVRLGFNLSSKINETGGQSYVYGIYPQYDNLKIDAGYMNDFGTRDIKDARTPASDVSGVTASVLAGAGLTFNLYGPLYADLSVHYDAGLTDIYKSHNVSDKAFSAENAPLTYTVNGGSELKPLTDWLSSSKMSQLSISVSLIYRF